MRNHCSPECKSMEGSSKSICKFRGTNCNPYAECVNDHIHAGSLVYPIIIFAQVAFRPSHPEPCTAAASLMSNNSPGATGCKTASGGKTIDCGTDDDLPGQPTAAPPQPRCTPCNSKRCTSNNASQAFSAAAASPFSRSVRSHRATLGDASKCLVSCESAKNCGGNQGDCSDAMPAFVRQPPTALRMGGSCATSTERTGSKCTKTSCSATNSQRKWKSLKKVTANFS
mmetsp:Transcript_2377/g.9337  ORF Transcript_2377/g.9337 Transcript_2377/m.9337 type:complete len:227 (+) Transcript_2377:299-979(+)